MHDPAEQMCESLNVKVSNCWADLNFQTTFFVEIKYLSERKENLRTASFTDKSLYSVW